jgi:predicted transcriptional regulator
MEEMMLWLFVGSRGGVNRARIVNLIHNKPCNTNQITEELNLNYKTVRHHLDLLEKNKIIKSNKEIKYGSVYFLTTEMKSNYRIFEEIYKKLKKNL